MRVCAGDPSVAHGATVMTEAVVGYRGQGLYAGGSPGGAPTAYNTPSVRRCRADHRGVVWEASHEPTPGMHRKGGEVPPPPLQGAQPMPRHCPPDAKCRPQWHL